MKKTLTLQRLCILQVQVWQPFNISKPCAQGIKQYTWAHTEIDREMV